MAYYDVFNGDADGICALQQLRLHAPRESILITGLKREINLLERVDATPADEITVLDISLDKNRIALLKALENGAKVFYADHHFAGEIPRHDRFEAHIDMAADTCTSLIINQLLENSHARWAVVGTFGDNFDEAAKSLGHSIGLNGKELEDLQQLGVCLNYNGYGFDLEDLLFHPQALFKIVNAYTDPLDFIENEVCYAELLAQYQMDMELCSSFKPESETGSGAIYILPYKSWAKRIVGVMGNDLAKQYPDRAHALLVDMNDGHYRVSVRAPYHRKSGADTLCRQFVTGGGRRAAAGINRLPFQSFDRFKQKFDSEFKDIE